MHNLLIAQLLYGVVLSPGEEVANWTVVESGGRKASLPCTRMVPPEAAKMMAAC